MKARNITDRAKRYRAQKNRPPGKHCTLCGSGPQKNLDVDHITGDESDGEPENLMLCCRSCNTRKAINQQRHHIGVRTRQYNPMKNLSFAEFKRQAKILLGTAAGDVAEATAKIRATVAKKRAEYAERMAAEQKKNPVPTFAQYAHGVSIHQRHAIDEGGAIIHATPKDVRAKYARKIARIKRERR